MCVLPQPQGLTQMALHSIQFNCILASSIFWHDQLRVSILTVCDTDAVLLWEEEKKTIMTKLLKVTKIGSSKSF